MEEVGKVISTSGNKAKVLINRSAACGECGACHIGKEKMTMETTALNQIKAEPGQEVYVEMRVLNVLTATGIAYGIPMIFFFVGILLGWFLAPVFHVEQVLWAFISGIVLTVLAYLVIYLLEKKGIFNLKFQPVITHLFADKRSNK